MCVIARVHQILMFLLQKALLDKLTSAKLCLNLFLCSYSFSSRIIINDDYNKTVNNFLILSFRRVIYVVCFLLGNSPASEFSGG